jgi:cation transport ATPase
MTHSMEGRIAVIPSSLSAPEIGLAVLIHTASMLAVAGVLAIVFFETYEKVGLRLLRHTWLNFDLLWAIALLVAGFVVLFF